jgi:type IV pilus assembly protein PilM
MSRVEAVRMGGVRVTGVDLAPFALLRALATPGSGDGAEAVVDVGARVTNVLVHSAGAPRFVRVLLGGGDRVVDELVTSGLDPDDARRLLRDEGVRPPAGGSSDARSSEVTVRAAERLADGVRGSLDYYTATQGGDPLRGVVLVGGTALVPGFADLLSEVVGLPVRRGDALAHLVVGRGGSAEGPDRDVAVLAGVPVGLALGGAA